MEFETFANPAPETHYIIQHVAEEFTSVCPKTGHPDFGVVILSYVADATCIELKSYKLYLQSFRDRGIFYEGVANELFADLWEALSPRWMRIELKWNPHGGIRTNLFREQRESGYDGPTAPFAVF